MRLEPDTFNKGRVRLYRGDCMEIIPRLRGKFGAVIFDPPYEKHMHNAKEGARGRKNYGAIRRIRTDGHANPKPVKFKSIDGVREVLVPLLVPRCTGWLVAFCTPEGIAAWRDEIEAAKARYKRACFWYKPDAAPQFNGQGPAFAVEAFVTAWCGTGVSRWNGGGRRNLFTHPTNNADRHGAFETEKPVALMMELIELFTQPDEFILDPMMGSATTILAAMATGRRVIGIEKDPETYKLARARVEAFPMGREQGRAHIAKAIYPTADAGPLFATLS